MKKKLIAMTILCSLVLSSCSASTEETNNDIESTSEESTVVETIAAVETAESVETTEPEETEFVPYVHGDEGYFNLYDEGYGSQVRLQVAGTCWVNAVSTSMETSYLMRTGESITIEPVDLVYAVYNEDKPEGWFAPNANLEYGGWTWEIVETLSNGWDSYIITDASMYEQDLDIETIQNGIRENGAMAVSINDTHGILYIKLFEDYFTFNAPANIAENFDHEVTIVGWDDNFPREYFAYEASQDGAWLCQNSLGSNWGNHGFYWVSYDMPFAEYAIVQISDEYDHVTAYDWGNEASISTGDETTIANVFHDSGTLRAVGTYTADLNTSVHIEIRDVNMENVLCEQDAFFAINGYHTVVLDTPIDVNNYSIVITFDAQAPVEGESFEIDTIEYFEATVNPGESYVLIDGEWVDMSSDNISELLGIDFIPNNCCIKAIF